MLDGNILLSDKSKDTIGKSKNLTNNPLMTIHKTNVWTKKKGWKCYENEFAASGIVLNKDEDKILMIYHKKINRWLPPGGHMDENELPHAAAIREVFEETGIKAVIIDKHIDLALTKGSEIQLPMPYVILHEEIAETLKDPKHMHVDFIYLMKNEVPESHLNLQAEEVTSGKWMNLNEIMNCNTFDSIKKICISLL